MRQISGSRDADVSFSEEDREKKLQVPKAELQPVRPPPLTTPYEVTVGPAPKRSGHCPQTRALCSQRSAAHLPTRGPAPGRAPAPLARRLRPPAVQTEAPAGLQVPATPGPRPWDGQRIGRNPGAQARERVWPIARPFEPCADGGGEKPSGVGTKAGFRAAAGG